MAKKKPAASPVATIELPLGELGGGYFSRRVDLSLPVESAKALRRVLNGLRANGQRLANDMPIRSNADVVRWLLEQVIRNNPSESETIRE